MARNLDDEGQKLIKATGKVWKTGDQGAAGTLVAAFDPALNGEPPFPTSQGCAFSLTTVRFALGVSLINSRIERSLHGRLSVC